MKSFSLIALSCLSVLLSACGDAKTVKTECEKSWKHIEEIGLKSGIPKEAIANQKKQFEEQVNSMPKADAIEICKKQSAIFEMAQEEKSKL